MITTVDAKEFINLSNQYKIIDVRSPSEFAQGHILNAINLPLLSDDERKVVGIKYKQEGKEGSVITGLELIGPKLSKLLVEAKKYAKNKTILLHCWRGGMRSTSFAFILSIGGINVFLLENGYKGFRNYAHQLFDKLEKIIILGGYTGSGKTEILEEINKQNQQVINLEDLAKHKGSAFGALQTEKQPTTEQFENMLFQELIKLDFNLPIWFEDESLELGTVKIPAILFKKMRNCNVIFLKIPSSQRIDKLVAEYGNINSEFLTNAITKITKKLGHLDAQLAITAIETNNLQQAAEILLRYYDKSYSYGISQRDASKVFIIDLPNTNSKDNAKRILAFLEKQTF